MKMNKEDISYPPVVGEYAYYDDRCPYYRMVDIMERDKGVMFGCVFSSKIKYEDTRYIKRHGIIRTILSCELRKHGTYVNRIDKFVYYN